jgi:hypothetical protein
LSKYVLPLLHKLTKMKIHFFAAFRTWNQVNYLTEKTTKLIPLPTLPEHLSAPKVFSGVRVA